MIQVGAGHEGIGAASPTPISNPVVGRRVNTAASMQPRPFVTNWTNWRQTQGGSEDPS